MKSNKYKLGTLILGLALLQAHASVLVNDPSGLSTVINSNTTTIVEEVGNINLASFNALNERVALTFESGDGYEGVAPNNTGNFVRVELLESAGSPLNMRVNFGSNGGYRVRSGLIPTGGTTDLVYKGLDTTTATIDFINPLIPGGATAQPVTGFAFTANRIGADTTVSLYSDLARSVQIGSTFTILTNTNKNSFFGYYDGGASIASVVISKSIATGDFSIDDINITTIPEPSTLLMLLLSASVFLPLYLRRKMRG